MGRINHSNRNTGFLLLIIAVMLLISSPSLTYPGQNAKLYIFWGRGCPHCEREMEFLKEMKAKYPGLEIIEYETWFNRANAELLARVADSLGIKAIGVPLTLVGNTAIGGFHSPETTGREIETRIKACIERGCEDPLGLALKPKKPHGERVVSLPGIGSIDAARFSLPVFTVIIAGLDSFNPCAFFVLFMLLSLLMHARSKKRMLFIGGTFIFFSGFIYFIFMAAWLNFFLHTGQIRFMTIISGLIALVVAALNIKDFFFFKKGISLSIPEKAKPGLFEKMRGLLKATSLTSMAAGTVILAITANTYELLCTAGFPMIFTRILTLQNLTRHQYYMYLVLYNSVYVIPLAVIVILFAVTLGARKLTEEQGRNLKLMSGIMMLSLAIILLLNPALLNNMVISIALLAIAVGTSFLIIIAAKKYGRERGAQV